MQRLGLRERLHETEVIDAWSKIVGDFIAAHSAPVALREGILYVRVLQPALHYELEQISSRNPRKLKQRFGAKTIRDVRFGLVGAVAGNLICRSECIERTVHARHPNGLLTSHPSLIHEALKLEVNETPSFRKE